MKKLTISEYAYLDPYSTGIGERNTVSSGRDVNPGPQANDLLASHFANCMRHGTTVVAMDNVLSASGSGINIGGHGDSGFLETGGGQGGPFPDDKCIYLYNEYFWGPQLDRLQGAAVTTISIWSCHVGAEQDGADLLFAMAKRAGHAVRAGTGFLYSNSRETWWQAGSVWQVATPNAKPAPINRPPGALMVTDKSQKLFFSMPQGDTPVKDIDEIEIELMTHGKQRNLTGITVQGDAARDIVKRLFAPQPMDFKDISVNALITAQITLKSKGGGIATFTVLNGGLAIDRDSNTGYYLLVDPASLIRFR